MYLKALLVFFCAGFVSLIRDFSSFTTGMVNEKFSMKPGDRTHMLEMRFTLRLKAPRLTLFKNLGFRIGNFIQLLKESEWLKPYFVS